MFVSVGHSVILVAIWIHDIKVYWWRQQRRQWWWCKWFCFFKSWVGNYKPKISHFQNVSRTGSNLLYGMYNDEIPDSVEGLTSSTYGHTKGTLHDTGLTLIFHIYVFLNRCKFIYGRCILFYFLVELQLDWVFVLWCHLT